MSLDIRWLFLIKSRLCRSPMGDRSVLRSPAFTQKAGLSFWGDSRTALQLVLAAKRYASHSTTAVPQMRR